MFTGLKKILEPNRGRILEILKGMEGRMKRLNDRIETRLKSNRVFKLFLFVQNLINDRKVVAVRREIRSIRPNV